jgi:hypothetical protein
MTVKKTNTITLEEVIAIQLECRQCKVKVSVPLSAQGRIPRQCAFCGDQWIVNNKAELHQIFFGSVSQLLNGMKQVSDGSNNVGCVLSIEVKPEINTAND